MPDIFSFGLGGGSLVTGVGTTLQIGPISVGYDLATRGRVFGGDVLTTTDIVVASGRAELGEKSLVADLSQAFIDDTLAFMQKRVEDAIDQMKLSRDPAPVILVGGGSILINEQLAGTSHVERPLHYHVANAVGAAIAQISGEVDRVVSLSEISRDEALSVAKQEAWDKAIAAGADASTIKIVDVEDIPLAYLPSAATRIRVKVAGDLKL